MFQRSSMSWGLESIVVGGEVRCDITIDLQLRRRDDFVFQRTIMFSLAIRSVVWFATLTNYYLQLVSEQR